MSTTIPKTRLRVRDLKPTETPGKFEIGDSSDHMDSLPPRGYSMWIEQGVYYSARKVKGNRKHAYAGGAWDNGIRDCPCGCYMGSSSSSGPVDPFGPCPWRA